MIAEDPEAAADARRSIAEDVRGRFGSREDAAIDFLREAILRGVYLPGDRLPQDAIAQELGISRMPVRASLRRLESEGLVEFHAYRGAVVRVLDAAEVREIYETRILLEQHLLRLAAEALDDSEVVDELAEVATSLRDSKEHHDTTWVEGRVAFYDRLYALAGRPRMATLVRDLRREVGPYLRVRDEVRDGLHDHHLTLLRLLREGDVDAAANELEAHLRTVSEQLQELVSEL